MSAPWYRIEGGVLLLRLRVQAGASRDEVAGPLGDRIKVRVAAKPVDNAANLRLASLLAAEFGVSPSQIKLLTGHSGRDKRVEIRRPARLPAWLDPNGH